MWSCGLYRLDITNKIHSHEGYMAKISINLKDGTVNKAEKQVTTIVGIDLGTTNSLIAFIKDGEPYAIKDQHGKHTLVPSIIHFDPKGDVIVGEAAKDHLVSNPERTIYSIKRLMGKSFGDVDQFDSFLGYEIIDEDTESLVKIKVDETFYTPTELSSKILQKLKRNAEKELKLEIQKAVITVPAYFNDAQRQATRDAGKLAGLDVLRIINEPTAASLAYGIGINREQSSVVAVYDLGGGTFDVSILEIQSGIFEVLATNGDTFLGGDDFDKVIVQHWMAALDLTEQQIDADKSLGQELRTQAEEAKKQLSSKSVFETTISGKSVSITKETFQSLIKPLVQKSITSCERALADSTLSISDIQEVILVGGSTRVPYVIEQVSAFFNRPAKHQINPDEVVALGAAIQADILAGNRKDMLLLDITPLSLGIETIGGLMDVLIPRNSKIPSALGRQYTTSVDGQTKLKVAVYQGERNLVSDNRKLGEFVLSGIPPMAAGMPKIEIQFLIDADGILRVKAKELRSEVNTEVEIKSTYGISEEDMARMLIDSLQHAEADMQIKVLQEAKNEANGILLASNKFLTQHRDILTDDEFEQTTSLIQSLATHVDSGTKDEINAAMQTLNTYTAPFAEKAMDKTIKAALSGKKI